MTADLGVITVNIATPHNHGGRSVEVRGKQRCSACGHRLTVDGVAPVQTRSLPVSYWPLEIIDRYRAIRLR